MSYNPLATIKQSPHQLGAIGAQTLMARINGRAESVSIIIDFSLVNRESSAPPSSRHAVTGKVRVEDEGSYSAYT
jgi:DNA-binding LacI/PurR family transcriptional regulator